MEKVNVEGVESGIINAIADKLNVLIDEYNSSLKYSYQAKSVSSKPYGINCDYSSGIDYKKTVANLKRFLEKHQYLKVLKEYKEKYGVDRLIEFRDDINFVIEKD